MLKDIAAVEELEKVIGKLEGVHSETSLLSRKAPNEALNPFKLKLVNKVIAAANGVLGEKYKPFDDFSEFDLEEIVTASDVVMVLSQYLQEVERYRSDNIHNKSGAHYYVINGEPCDIRTSHPKKLYKK